MASILNVFEPKTKIKSSEVNENFELVQKDVSEMGQALNTYVEGEIASVQSTVSSVQATLQENINTVSDKLSNVYDDIAPDYTKGFSISKGWKATKNGWIKYRLYSSASGDTNMQIDGKVVAENWQGKGDGRAGGFYLSGMTYILKNQVVTLGGAQANDSNNSGALYFYPCKGAV